MHTQVLERPDNTTTGANECHIYCQCDETTALCGVDVTGQGVDDTIQATCLVCIDLEPLPCERCGDY